MRLVKYRLQSLFLITICLIQPGALRNSSGHVWHPSKLCLAVSYRIVKLVKVASWPQIIIDIGHLIYMIGSHQTPDHTERIQSSTARATSTAVRPLQRSSLELADI